MSDDTWTEEWPTTPGKYWFYGWGFGNKKEKPEMGFCKAFRSMTSLVFVLNGHFIYKSEAIGVWQPATLPEPPEMIAGLMFDK